MTEIIGTLFAIAVLTLAIGFVYKPVREFVADLLFALACFFGAFYEVLRRMSHDWRNFDPKSTKIEQPEEQTAA